MPGRIFCAFGKKGSGKSTLTKQYMLRWGGRVVFMSPVEDIGIDHSEAWEFLDIEGKMSELRPGDILLIKRVGIDTMDFVGACALAVGDYTIVIDEVDKFKGSKQLLDLVHYSRHAKIDLICNTRRFADMPRLITSQADELAFFRSHEPADFDYVRKLAGKEFAEAVKELPIYHYMIYPERERIKTVDYCI